LVTPAILVRDSTAIFFGGIRSGRVPRVVFAAGKHTFFRRTSTDDHQQRFYPGSFMIAHLSSPCLYEIDAQADDDILPDAAVQWVASFAAPLLYLAELYLNQSFPARERHCNYITMAVMPPPKIDNFP
jgi:hypothetical protein